MCNAKQVMDLWADGSGEEKCSEINFSMGRAVIRSLPVESKGKRQFLFWAVLVTALKSQ